MSIYCQILKIESIQSVFLSFILSNKKILNERFVAQFPTQGFPRVST